MSTTALAILGDGYTIQITPEAEAQRNTIVEAAKRIVAVTDSDSCDLAQSRIKALATVRNAVEKSRNEVKKPVLELGRHIDGIAKDFVGIVIEEEARLGSLVNAYAAEQQRIARERQLEAERERQRIERERHEAEMAAQREAARIERERMEAERRAHEAEIDRLKAEAAQSAEGQAAARAAQEAALAAQREAEARAEAARVQAEQERIAAEERERQAIAAAAVSTPVMPNGVKEEIDFEVTDIHEFAAKFPQLVTITPKRADIISALKKSFAKNGKLPQVAGLRVFQNLKVKTR